MNLAVSQSYIIQPPWQSVSVCQILRGIAWPRANGLQCSCAMLRKVPAGNSPLPLCQRSPASFHSQPCCSLEDLIL